MLRIVRLILAGLAFAWAMVSGAAEIDADAPAAIYQKVRTLDRQLAAMEKRGFEPARKPGEKPGEKQEGRSAGGWLNTIVGEALGDAWPLIEERTALEVKLEELAVAGNAEASFYSGVLALEFGRKLSRGAYTDEYSRSYFEKAIKHFNRASQAGVGESSWNLATMYQAGEGILASKLAAAEWYHKAGLQYLAAGRREDALACLEQIEAMNVSHPSRADLRERLFPEKKGGHNRNRP